MGDALRGGFTEWEFSGDTYSGDVYTVAITIPEAGYYIYTLYVNKSALATATYTTDDISTVDFNVGPDSTITATRHAFPPTKTSQLSNDSGYIAITNENLKVGYNVNAYSENSIVVGKSSSIRNGQCASFGENNTINGAGSIAAGINLSVSQNCEYSTVLGTNSVASCNRSFVWNSVSDKYFSNGERTFNVNPKDKLSGFYIGTDNFINCVLSAIN